jgi:hypothetical protein
MLPGQLRLFPIERQLARLQAAERFADVFRNRLKF